MIKHDSISNRPNLLDFDASNLEDYFRSRNEQPFRARQVLKWIHQAGTVDFAQMTNLSKALRASLAESACISLPDIVKQQISSDGTTKWLLKVDSGNAIETVFIPEADRGTLCVSSQVGCPLDCRFCATARQGFNRNLTTGEIVAQLLMATRALETRHNDAVDRLNSEFTTTRKSITNVVMMGMGEPLLNFDNVVRAMRIMMDDNAYGLARRRVTLSTAGHVPGIDRLRDECPVSLAISLHAPTDDLRDRLVPLNKKYPIETLLAACQRYTDANPHDRITFEYVMLKDVNDDLNCAKQLIRILEGIPAKINLIPFNPFPGAPFDCSDKSVIDAFRDRLIKAGLVTVTRKTRGDDIDAACGQLVGNVLAKSKRRAKAPALTTTQQASQTITSHEVGM